MSDERTPAAPREQPRLAFIEGLRGIAAIVVVLQHAMEEYHQATPAGLLAHDFVHWLLVQTIYLGRFGVVLFFMISGFVVPLSMRGPAPIRHFTVSRLFRLYPAYWLCIALAIVIGAPRADDPFTLRGELLSLTMIPHTLHGPFLYAHFWTLEVEIAFYVLCVLVFPARLLTRTATTFALLVALLAIGLLPALRPAPGVPLNFSRAWLVFQPYLLLGTLTRLATERRGPRDLALLGVAVLLVALSVPLTTGLVRPVAFIGLFGQPVPTAVGTWAGIAAFLLCLRWRWPADRLAGWLGRVSYSTYLFHWPVLILILRAAPAFGRSLPLLLVAGVAATLAVATLVYRFVEQPMIRIGRRWAGRPREGLAAQVAP